MNKEFSPHIFISNTLSLQQPSCVGSIVPIKSEKMQMQMNWSNLAKIQHRMEMKVSQILLSFPLHRPETRWKNKMKETKILKNLGVLWQRERVLRNTILPWDGKQGRHDPHHCPSTLCWKLQVAQYNSDGNGGIGMGNTCKSMADSCQCMAKSNTIL